MIYFNQKKEAFAFKIENPLCSVPMEQWSEFSTLTLGEEYDVNETGIVDLRQTKEYLEKQAQKERERIQELFMTRSDFFDGTIDAWGVGEDELLFLVQRMLTGLPLEAKQKLKAINNFKNALNFYRKHDLFKMLIGIPIQLTETTQVIITEESLDKYFDEVAKGNKATAWQYLPQPMAIPIETPGEIL